MKKIFFILILGAFVFNACGTTGSENETGDGSGENTDNGGGTNAETLKLSYAKTFVFGLVDTAIPTITQTEANPDGVSFSIAPALPTGINIDTSTGEISGTPTETKDQTTYTVTISKSGLDSKTFDIDFVVKKWNHPGISDEFTPNNNGTSSHNFKTAMNDNGNAIIVWLQSSDDPVTANHVKIYKREYKNGAWQDEDGNEDVVADGTVNQLDDYFVNSAATQLDVAMDNSGNIIIVWANAYHIYIKEFRSNAWQAQDLAPDGATYGNDTYHPHVTMNNNGDAIIVWYGKYSSGSCASSSCTRIYKREYRNGTWQDEDENNNGTTNELDDYISPTTQTATFGSTMPSVDMNDNNHAIIVWREKDGTTDCSGNPCERIFKTEYNGVGWNSSRDFSLTNNSISVAESSAGTPHVAKSNNGNAVITWQQSGKIFISEYRGNAWDNPDDINDTISPDTGDATDPALAMDNKGNTIIVWKQGTGSDIKVFKSEYRNGSWTHPSTTDYISYDTNGSSSDNVIGLPNVAMDNNQNAIIIWAQDDSSNQQIFKSEYHNGTWEHPNSLSDNISPNGESVYGDNSFKPNIVMGDNADALAVWELNAVINNHRKLYRSHLK